MNKEIYFFELHPREYGFSKSKKGWEKKFPPLSRKSQFKYTFRADKSMISVYRQRAKQMHVDCHAYKREYARNNTYRKKFMEKHPPIAGRYRCWYCGKRCRNITVDHIYPVKQVQTDERLQRKLKRKGIRNVNDEKNLAFCCEKCNKKKGKTIGNYPRKAAFGKHEMYWVLVGIVRIFIILIVIGLCLCFLKPNTAVGQFLVDLFRKIKIS